MSGSDPFGGLKVMGGAEPGGVVGRNWVCGPLNGAEGVGGGLWGLLILMGVQRAWGGGGVSELGVSSCKSSVCCGVSWCPHWSLCKGCAPQLVLVQDPSIPACPCARHVCPSVSYCGPWCILVQALGALVRHRVSWVCCSAGSGCPGASSCESCAPWCILVHPGASSCEPCAPSCILVRALGVPMCSCTSCVHGGVPCCGLWASWCTLV